MKQLFVLLMIASTHYAIAAEDQPKWLCRSGLQMNKVIMSEQHVVDLEDQRIVAVENESYALTIEATAEKLELHILRKAGNGAGVIASASANRKDSLKSELLVPLETGFISMSCERATSEGQSDNDRLAIKDIPNSRRPAVDSLYIRRLFPNSIQQ